MRLKNIIIQTNILLKITAETLICIPKPYKTNGPYTLIDNKHDRYSITALTNEQGRNKLIGEVYLRPGILYSIDVIKT